MSTTEVAKAHVARLFFLRGLSKQEIAGRLGISRFKVARLLEQARAEGIVRIEVRDPVPTADPLGQALERAFGLDLAVVVGEGAAPDDVPRAAAAWLPQLLPSRGTLGVAWGDTLRRVADALPPPGPSGPEVVQLCGAIAGVELGSGPAELAVRFAERLGGRPHPLAAPALAGARARADLLANAAVGPTIAMFDRMDAALVGIGALGAGGRSSLLRSGSVPRDALRDLGRRGAVGDLVVHVFDSEGRILATDLADRAIAIGLDQLARVPRVVAVAGGAGKEDAVAGALRTGLIDVVVTDADCATRALEGAP